MQQNWPQKTEEQPTRPFFQGRLRLVADGGVVPCIAMREGDVR